PCRGTADHSNEVAPSHLPALARNWHRNVKAGDWKRSGGRLSMSALGHKRTLRLVRLMSALPPKADIGTRSWNVRFVPIADSCSAAKEPLFDHLICRIQKARRYCEAERFGGLKVDGQFVFGWCLHWKVGRLLALEDAINVACSRTIRVDRIRAVGD